MGKSRMILVGVLVAMFLGGGLAWGAEVRVWYVAESPGTLPQGITGVALSDLLSKRGEIASVDSKAVIVERKTFEKVGPMELEFFRNAVLELRRVVWLTGEEVPLDLLASRLKVARKIRRADKTNLRVLGDGLYRRPDGVVAGATVYTLEPWSRVESLKEILRATEEIVQGQKRPSAAKDDWKLQDEQRDFHREKWGRFDKRNEVWLLVNHQRPVDYWYVRVENVSTPEQDFLNKRNEDENGLETSDQLLCYGPENVVGPNQEAKIRVGCPGPTREWSWLTGATKVRDLTRKQSKAAAWEVEFDTAGKEAREAHRWEPGFESDNPRGRDFVVRIETKLKWADKQGRSYEGPPKVWPRLVVSP